MLKVDKIGVILSKTNLFFENEGVFNPGVIEFDGKIHLFYRAVSNGNFSSIGYCLLSEPSTIEIRNKRPLVAPVFEFEIHGMEDPRIVKIDTLFYMTYTAFDGVNALGALAVSSDLVHFYKTGIIVPLLPVKVFAKALQFEASEDQIKREINSGKTNLIWDKNVVLFPRKINENFVFFHRIKPFISIVFVASFENLTESFWEGYFANEHSFILHLESFHLEKVSYFGAGCPPIEISQGWLFIYHAVYDLEVGLVYKTHVVILNLLNPLIIEAYLPYPLLEPEYNWEKVGVVNNVVFPTGALLRDQTLYIYYGAADNCIACAAINLPELLTSLIFTNQQSNHDEITNTHS
jgi:predicted GH43/DUF377 family glycosyl hydrolase